MAHFHIKKKNGRPYLYVREIARVNGQPKVISQIYIGTPEKAAQLAKGVGTTESRLKVEEFGALWVGSQIDSEIGLSHIIDQIVPSQDNEKGPSVGEYFLYCVWNRMIDAQSKNKLVDWYKRTAIQQIHPVDVDALTSQRYWEKWDRVSEQDLQQITRRFFKKVWDTAGATSDCLLFDTTNYYTFMDSQTESDLAKRGKNKESRHHLRQIGLGLLVSREKRLPLYYSVYPGNIHDSRLFETLMDEMFGIVCGFNQTKQRLTVVIDKGMNSEGNYSWIDEHQRLHFITTYSTYFAQKLAATPVHRFEPVDLERNRRLREEGKVEDQLMVYRTRGVFWGKERTVVVTYNPVTARKKDYTIDSRLETVRQELLAMRTKVNSGSAHWRKEAAVRERYVRLCERLHIPADLYRLAFQTTGTGLMMTFRQDAYRVKCTKATYGKNIIITDNHDWTTQDIVTANLDRWQVEDRFRISKDDDLVAVQPVRHWTDSKLRCHLFTCVVAMTYLRLIELQLAQAGIQRTAQQVMEDMHHLHSVVTMQSLRSRPVRKLEQPTKTQAEVLKAFGYKIDAYGVLHKITR